MTIIKKMETKEEAEEVLSELLGRLGISNRLYVSIEKDENYYIRIN